MPRKILTPQSPPRRRPSALVEILARELRSGRESGQPSIEEEHFKTGSIRIVVLWDRWEGISPEDRVEAIVDAYRMVEGEEFASRIGLVNGLTFPEAHASGMLPYQVIAALRKGDPVDLGQCHRAMIEEGASTLMDQARPQLRFATEEEAAACIRRLAARLPGSEPVWQVLREVGQDLDSTWDVAE